MYIQVICVTPCVYKYNTLYNLYIHKICIYYGVRLQDSENIYTIYFCVKNKEWKYTHVPKQGCSIIVAFVWFTFFFNNIPLLCVLFYLLF